MWAGGLTYPHPPPQRKRTAHERAKELYASGEFSSGRKWADDAPKERLDTNAVNLIASGACGAFVHGLEDEMYGTYVCVCDFRRAVMGQWCGREGRHRRGWI